MPGKGFVQLQGLLECAGHSRNDRRGASANMEHDDVHLNGDRKQHGGFHSHGATPIAGWFIRDQDGWFGGTYFRTPPYLGNADALCVGVLLVLPLGECDANALANLRAKSRPQKWIRHPTGCPGKKLKLMWRICCHTGHDFVCVCIYRSCKWIAGTPLHTYALVMASTKNYVTGNLGR